MSLPEYALQQFESLDLTDAQRAVLVDLVYSKKQSSERLRKHHGEAANAFKHDDPAIERSEIAQHQYYATLHTGRMSLCDDLIQLLEGDE